MSNNPNSDSSDSFRIRQTIRETFHKIIDKDNPSNDVSKTTLPNSDGQRVRQAIREAFHRVVGPSPADSSEDLPSSDSRIRQTIHDTVRRVVDKPDKIINSIKGILIKIRLIDIRYKSVVFNFFGQWPIL